MSCFVVPDFHINALVNWGARAGAVKGISLDALAHMLACANRAAFSERYAGRYDSELVPFAGLDRLAGADLAPVAIVKACDCLEYQASDWTAWRESEAAAHARGLSGGPDRCQVRGRYLPDLDPDAVPGYRSAPWCLDEVAA